MAHNIKGSKGHPARVNGIHKKKMERLVNQNSIKIKRPFQKIDISKSNWK